MTHEGILAVIDFETTGLNPWMNEHPLEVACILVDENLNEIPGGTFHSVIGYGPNIAPALKLRSDPDVQNMHTDNGLWEEIAHPAARRVDLVDELLLGHVRQFAPMPRQARMLGNSIRLDLNFLEAYLPGTYSHLHYRSVDMTAIEHFAILAGHPAFQARTTTVSNHRALDDAKFSLEQARYWREVLAKQ